MRETKGKLWEAGIEKSPYTKYEEEIPLKVL
jgi:hypothetical protein